MVKVQNFHERLEHDLERLTASIQSVKERPEAREWSEREVLKHSLQAFGETVTTPLPPPPPQEEKSRKDSLLPGYLERDGADPRVKLEIEKLVDLVFHESLGRAMREAGKHPPFVQDAFHDALVDKLLPELKRRKVL